MTTPSRLGLQKLILLALVPVLVAMTVAVAALAYRERERAILRGFDAKLTAVSTVSAAFIPADRHEALLDAIRAGRTAEEIEATPDYGRIAEPLRRIRQALGLTYLYTQVPTGGADIVYVLDANTDADHSPPGTTDTLPEGDADSILAVARSGVPFVSGIQEWEQWGLIKTGFAAIRDADGRIVAMAGADVDISTIREKTRFALVSAGLVGALSLILSLAAAILVARRLAAPLRAIKLAGFGLAAGGPRASVDPRGPVEVRQLAAAFNQMAAAMRQEMEQAESVDLLTEEDRRARCLLRLLENEDRWRGAGPVQVDGPAAVGTAEMQGDGRCTVGWVRVPEADPLGDRIRLLQMAELAAMLGGGCAEAAMLLDRLRPMLGRHALMLFAISGDRLLVRSAVPFEAGGRLAAGDHTLLVGDGATLTVAGTRILIGHRAEVPA